MLGEVVHLDGSHDSDVLWASMRLVSLRGLEGA